MPRRPAFTLLELLVTVLVIAGIATGCFLLIGCGGDKPIPPDHAVMRVFMPAKSEAEKLDIVVNNQKVGTARRDSTVTVSFPPLPDGNNTVTFGASSRHSFVASAGTELNVSVSYTYKSFTSDIYAVDIVTAKAGEPLAVVESASLAPDLIRREASRETLRGNPGEKSTYKRKRTFERQVTLSETAKVEVSATAKLGFGPLEASAQIRASLSQKDTVLLRDKEEFEQSLEVVVGTSGAVTLVWVDHIKKGRAAYKYNGRSKEIEFEIPYSTELTILRE